MSLPLPVAHTRYSQQALWTRDLRNYVFAQAGVTPRSRILEVGAGTAAVLGALPTPNAAQGLDIDLAALRFARQSRPELPLAAGDAHRLPYPEDSFDLVYCHFLLLWLPDTTTALAEMQRVARPGAIVAAFAEPNYRARIDQPAELAELGRLQAQALAARGANPGIGFELPALLRQAGLVDVESGTLSMQPVRQMDVESIKLEQQVLRRDLQEHLEQDALERLLDLDRAAWKTGQRVLFVPTHYAWGYVG